MPRLQILNGKRQGVIVDVPWGSEQVIGHRQSAHISIDDPWVSWDHARIFFEPNGQGPVCWIEDLGSTNGTYVNCVRVKREKLKHEDIIFLGKTHVIFLAPAEELDAVAASDPADPFAAARQVDPFPSSNSEPFFESSSMPPLRGAAPHDPFASVGNPDRAPLWNPAAEQQRAKDPFSDSSVDPFALGPDYSLGPGAPARVDPTQSADDLSFLTPKDPDPSLDYAAPVDPFAAQAAGIPVDPFAAPPPPPPPRSPAPLNPFSAQAASNPPSNPFAETRGDEQLSPLSGAPMPRSLSLSDLQNDDEPDLPGPSSQEIADLIGNSREIYANDPLLAAAGQEFPGMESTDELDSPASEMRTRQIDTTEVSRLVAQEERQRAAEAQRALAKPVGTPADAYDRARLQDEVRRLRGALQAAQQQNPQAVQLAANALRDQELGRLAQRVAELERDLAGARAALQQARAELEERTNELNFVTEDMIEKEDLIDELRDQVSRLEGSGSGSGSFSAAGQEDLSSLEF